LPLPVYATYEWLDGNGNPLNPQVLNDTLKLINPQIGGHYIASLGSLSAPGCETQLDVFILNYSYVPVQTTVLNLLCNGVTTGNATAIVDSTILHGTFFLPMVQCARSNTQCHKSCIQYKYSRNLLGQGTKMLAVVEIFNQIQQ
jgi:hypothetical protein